MKRLLCLLLTAFTLSTTRAATLEIREGDHICLIGNTLAERMQFEGHNHWETLLHQRFPKHKLVVRNLAWSADEVALRPRAEGFGTPDEHLAACRADVVIAFFGFNESFAGEAGLEKFKSDLDEWVKHTKAQDYDGCSASHTTPDLRWVAPGTHDALQADGAPRTQTFVPGVRLLRMALPSLMICGAVGTSRWVERSGSL